MVLYGQSTIWSHVKAGVSQGSILGTLLVLFCINDLPEILTTSDKHFADDNSLFSVVHGSAASSAFLYDDFLKICGWAYQSKIIFNPDVSKQTQEIVFFRKASATNHGTIYFNNVVMIKKIIQKHLGLFLYYRLNLFDHTNEKRLLKGLIL